ncbi:hypothetical protein E2C01_005544 [Portunus trituberculatus]|uniref:Uncharacterized protein n=1 Tax=Portunus trituberculatus TaxID=210409 RepID=A0A5B7CTR9_PORTR|nr:hypothetical protein [Portunus trituberculatus]
MKENYCISNVTQTTQGKLPQPPSSSLPRTLDNGVLPAAALASCEERGPVPWCFEACLLSFAC